MAKGNGRLTAKSVSVWFEAMPFDGQVAVLDELQKAHSKVRQVQINSLKRQLAALENGSRYFTFTLLFFGWRLEAFGSACPLLEPFSNAANCRFSKLICTWRTLL